MFDFSHPFFRPLWVRIAVVGVASGWTLFEFLSGSLIWGTVFGMLAAASFVGLFITFNPREPDTKKDR